MMLAGRGDRAHDRQAPPPPPGLVSRATALANLTMSVVVQSEKINGDLQLVIHY